MVALLSEVYRHWGEFVTCIECMDARHLIDWEVGRHTRRTELVT